MTDTLYGYWGFEQLSRDLPMPYVSATSAGHSFSSEAVIPPPQPVEEGDSLIGIVALRFDAAAELTDLPDGFAILADYDRNDEPDYSHIYLIRKEATAEPEPAFYFFEKSAGGFICVSVHVVKGAGPISQWVHSAPPFPGDIPPITTVKPNTLLMCGYTARFGMNQFVPPPPDPPEWEGVGPAYVTIHWNCYQREAVVPGTYGPTPVSPFAYAQDQFLVFAIDPIPAPPEPLLTITKIEPASGIFAGGTTVTVTGTGFAYGATEIQFGDVLLEANDPADEVQVLSGEELTFVVPELVSDDKTVVPVTAQIGDLVSNELYFTYNVDGAFSPASIDGLQVWLDAGESSTIDVSGTAILEWRDLSIHQHEFFSPEVGWRPQYDDDAVNGMGVVNFVDEDFVQSRVLMLTEGRPRTFVWVMEPEGSGPMGIFGHLNQNDPRIEINASNILYLNCGIEINTDVPTTGLHVWVVLCNAMNSKVWKDGILVWEGDLGSSLYPGVLRIGVNGVSQFFEGVIHEVATYNVEFTETERVDLTEYLLNKWAGGPFRPFAPVLVAAEGGNTVANLDWNVPTSNGGSPITDYVMEYSLNGTTGWTVGSDPTSTTTNGTVTGLSNETTYYFRVAAVNAVGQGAYSNIMSTMPSTPTIPGAPIQNVPESGDTEIALSWLAPSANGGVPITDYVIQRSLNGTTGWSTISDGVSTALSYINTGLTNGTEYFYRIAAVNSVGTGPYSNVESSIPTIPGTSWSDDFNRADAGTLGPDWDIVFGAIGIVSNQARTVDGDGRDFALYVEECTT